MVKKYTIVELLTSVKPFYFSWLFDNYPSANKIVYLDPDINVFQPLTKLDASLEEFDIVLTPHFTGPIQDNYMPTELHIMQTGVFNLGFIGVKRSDNVYAMLSWWQDKLKNHCIIDLSRGLFVDQLWANLMPLYFDRVLIEKYPGYNMAHWNLHERTLEKINGEWFVNGQPLIFYHFSHYNPALPDSIATHHDRFSFRTRPDLLEIFNCYHQGLMSEGYVDFRKVPCYYMHNETKKKRRRNIENFLRQALPNELKGKLKNFRKIFMGS